MKFYKQEEAFVELQNTLWSSRVNKLITECAARLNKCPTMKDDEYEFLVRVLADDVILQ